MIDDLRLFLTNNLILPVIGIFVVSIMITAVGTAILIPILRRSKAKQTIHEDVPDNHQEKAGTPTMGGIAIVIGACIATLVSCIYFGKIQTEVIVILVGFVAFALLGFLDDFHKIKNKRNLGLTAKQKLFVQCFIALVISLIFVIYEGRSTDISIPFTDINFDMGYFYIPFMTFAVVAMVNSVNLTDGLDGLASGVSLIVCLFFAAATVSYSILSANWFFVALAGACVGFLIFNKNPAKIFMGDTGSLALGGGISIAAFYVDMEIIMIIAGFVYVAEALSDIIQVASYKLRGGKRVFKMAPLHHHFELSGWSERRVVAVFMFVTLILCVISALAI